MAQIRFFQNFLVADVRDKRVRYPKDAAQTFTVNGVESVSVSSPLPPRPENRGPFNFRVWKTIFQSALLLIVNATRIPPGLRVHFRRTRAPR